MYLLGINLPDNKLVRVALTSIYGIGLSTGQKICNQLEIHPQCRLNQLPEHKLTKLSQLLNTMTIEAELKRQVRNRVQAMVEIGCYKGKRHLARKPVNGQRTRTNASTAKMLNGRFLARSFSTLARFL